MSSQPKRSAAKDSAEPSKPPWTYYKPPPDQAVIDLSYQQAVDSIGKVSVEFQLLETHLKVGIRLLVDPNDVGLGTILTAQLSFKAILDLFGALYNHRFQDPAQAKELGEFLGQCDVAERRRNQIIHSNWLPDTTGAKGAVRLKSTARKILKSQREVISKDDLLKEAEGLRALRDAFFNVWSPRVQRYVNSVPRRKSLYLDPPAGDSRP